ncbi:putative efflux protein, MATE family [Lachnospiraceae bacterium]|nr:putative efflux protein, MATE family [Lachnospiraceae bacterium]
MEKTKENKMGTMPINKLILTMSVPMMISMLVQALYNIVDSIYVSQINEHALTAVSLIFPMQMLMIAFGTGLGVGFSSLLSRSLGEKNQEYVDKSAMNGLFLEICAAIIFFIIGMTLPEFFMRTQTDDAEIVEYGIQYMSIICRCSIFLFFQMSFERLLQSTGKTIFTMITQSLGAVINIILDPILIFGLYGFPKLGVSGAAVATIFGQSAAGILAIIFNLKINKEVHFHVKNFKPDPHIIKEIFVVGIPSIIMQAIGSVMTYGMNQILISFTTTASAVFGVYFKINSFIFMPVFGLNNGLVPVLAFNFGAGKKSRMSKAFRLGIMYAFIIMTFGTILFLTLPGFFLSLFNASEDMLTIGIPALRIISISFPLAAVSIICGSLFQALGNGIYSMITSFLRQLIVLLPAAYLLSLTGVLRNVWWSYVIAEVFALMLSMFFLKRIYSTTIAKMDINE